MEKVDEKPQVSLRWTPETPIEVLYFVMDAERHDFYKRIALFVSILASYTITVYWIIKPILTNYVVMHP